jgi:hypothetical protein
MAKRNSSPATPGKWTLRQNCLRCADPFVSGPAGDVSIVTCRTGFRPDSFHLEHIGARQRPKPNFFNELAI